MNKILLIVLVLVGTVFAAVGLLTLFIVIDIRSKYAGQTIGGEAGEFVSVVGSVAFISLLISGVLFYLVYRMKRKKR